MLLAARWSLATLVGYLTGRALGHVLSRIDAHLARITDLGGEE